MRFYKIPLAAVCLLAAAPLAAAGEYTLRIDEVRMTAKGPVAERLPGFSAELKLEAGKPFFLSRAEGGAEIAFSGIAKSVGKHQLRLEKFRMQYRHPRGGVGASTGGITVLAGETRRWIGFTVGDDKSQIVLSLDRPGMAREKRARRLRIEKYCQELIDEENERRKKAEAKK